MEHLFQWALCEQNPEGAPLLVTMKDMLRKALVMSISFHSDSLGKLEGDSFTGEFEKWTKVMEKRIWKRTSLSIGVPLRNLEGGSFACDFERWLKGAVKVERLSLRELCEGNLEGVEVLVLYWGPWRMCNGRFWRQASLSIEAPLGNLERGCSTGDFER
jgi:hypothetical protein